MIFLSLAVIGTVSFLLFSGDAKASPILFPAKSGPVVAPPSGDTVNNAYDYLFIKYSNQFGVDWKFSKRIAWIESRIGLAKAVKLGIENPFNVEGSKSGDGISWGIMQTTLATARSYNALADAILLNNPEQSIKIGIQHIAFLKRNYPQFNERDLAMAYNHGQGNQLRFIEKEKADTLKATEYLAGRDYYSKYLQAKALIP